MKTILYLILLACFFIVNIYADSNLYRRRIPRRTKHPVTDTIGFIHTRPDTVAVYSKNGIVCYSDGSVIVEALKYRITELNELIDSTDPEERKCVQNYQENLNLCFNEMKEHHDTINLNKLNFNINSFCSMNEDLIKDQLTTFTYKVSNLKTGKDEPMLIRYRIHKNRRKWYDQIRTTNKINIYKGIGTLDKF